MVGFPVVPSLAVGDVDAYAEFMRPLITPWLRQAWVAIVDPNTRVIVPNDYGAVSTVTVDPDKLVWFGYARIQPLRTSIFLKRAIDSTTTRTTQFQLLDFPKDNNSPALIAGYEVVVIDGHNDPSLKDYQYYLTGAQNSSMAWQRTVETTVNQEARPAYVTTNWPQPGTPFPLPTPDPEEGD